MVAARKAISRRLPLSEVMLAGSGRLEASEAVVLEKSAAFPLEVGFSINYLFVNVPVKSDEGTRSWLESNIISFKTK